MFVLSNHSAISLQLAFALMSDEEVRIPQIENDATVFTHLCTQLIIMSQSFGYFDSRTNREIQ
jgi:hypothetical protein